MDFASQFVQAEEGLWMVVMGQEDMIDLIANFNMYYLFFVSFRDSVASWICKFRKMIMINQVYSHTQA